MMKIGNLLSIESVGVNFKEGICAKLCLPLVFCLNSGLSSFVFILPSICYFCYITKSGWFRKRQSRMKVLNKQFLKPVKKYSYTEITQNWCSWIFAIFTWKHLFCSLFLIKLQASRPATLLKRDFNTGFFQWILQKFYEQLFL